MGCPDGVRTPSSLRGRTVAISRARALALALAPDLLLPDPDLFQGKRGLGRRGAAAPAWPTRAGWSPNGAMKRSSSDCPRTKWSPSSRSSATTGMACLGRRAARPTGSGRGATTCAARSRACRRRQPHGTVVGAGPTPRRRATWPRRKSSCADTELARRTTPMEADDLPEFAKALTALAECFGEPLSVARIEAYFSALDDLPLANVQEALAGAMRTKTFFPKPAELRDLAGCQGPDVGEAYAELSVALRRYYWKAPAVSPAVDMIVQRMGGWRTVAMMS